MDHIERKKKTKSEAGRIGGLARQARYGDLGTPEGRRLGGLRSQATHKKHTTGFNLLKKVKLPKYSVALAELCGILAGDGHVGTYQVSMTTNARTDKQHARHVQTLFTEIFQIRATIAKRSDSNAVVVVASSKVLCDFFKKIGLTQGNKVLEQLPIPKWVELNTFYAQAFVRGLFDTDGCVYSDTHVIREKTYKNIGIAFVNRSLPLLGFFKNTIESLGLHPTQKTKYTVFLRRKKDIVRYFEIIGSSNEKHLKRFCEFV